MASQSTTTCAEAHEKAQIEQGALQRPAHIDLHGNVFELPKFTMKEIYDAIPAHCFKPSIPRGLAYVARDYLYLGVVIYATYRYTPLIPSAYLRGFVYGLCTVLEGIIMTGIWILAHECGHGAFSKNKRLNDSVGFVLHSSLLVPYYSWKITHAHHHKATGDMKRDTVFVPHDREGWIKHNLGHDTDPMTVESISEDAPVVTLMHCVLVQLLGWPLYMLDNLSGQDEQHGFPYYSHYWFGKGSGIFKESELRLVFYSDIGILLTTVLLYLGVKTFGWWEMLVFYGVPYLWLNHWIVLITFLQHTDGRLPHYTHSQWTFARGAAATIDRDFGFIDTHLFHNIVGTHVVHHLVSSIPFYHAQEATEAIKKVMGDQYHADLETPLFSAFWKSRRDCQFVEESPGMEGSGVLMFRNLHGRGVKPRKLGGVRH